MASAKAYAVNQRQCQYEVYQEKTMPYFSIASVARKTYSYNFSRTMYSVLLPWRLMASVKRQQGRIRDTSVGRGGDASILFQETI